MKPTTLLSAGALLLATIAPAFAQSGVTPAPDRPEILRRVQPRVYTYETERAPRAAIGVNTSASGTLRDTLGLLITSVTRGGPAEKAGLEEGNRITAVNGVNLRAAAADVEDFGTTGTLARRLVRELEKVKPGDEVELRVYGAGRTRSVRVRTVDSDSLFRRATTLRGASRPDMDDRPVLGFALGATGTQRDTLGVLVMSVPDSTPAARAGLEEGNRIASINGVNLRVAREDAGDRSAGQAKAQRLMREVSQLKPNDNVTLRVYASGQWRDVTMKVARAGDLGRQGGMRFFGPEGAVPPMPVRPMAVPWGGMRM